MLTKRQLNTTRGELRSAKLLAVVYPHAQYMEGFIKGLDHALDLLDHAEHASIAELRNEVKRRLER